MKHRLTFTLIFAAALAAAPAMAQRSVSGTIGGAAHATAVPNTAAAPAPAGDGAAAAVPAAVSASNAATAAAPAAPAAAAAGATPSGPLAMTIPTPQPSTASGGGLLQTMLALLFVLALVLGFAWLMKRYGPKNFGAGNSTVKLVGSLNVGTRERILVVEVGDQWVVVGATPGRMNALATMPRQETSVPAGQATVPTANFAEWFKQTIDKRNGK